VVRLDPRRYVGEILTGGYRLDRVIGRGGFAAVYHARRFDGAEAAVKILLLESERARKRFVREIKVMQSLPASPHLVGYVAHGSTWDGRPFLAMDYVPGMTLAQKQREEGVLPERDACVVAYQVALALQALHCYGIVHRDVKPTNVLLCQGGVVKLFDFGLVLDSEGLLRLFEEADILQGSDFAEDLEEGIVAGTPQYMAPEQFFWAIEKDVGAPPVTAAADVFSVGVMLHRLLVGRLPLELDKKSRPSTPRKVMAFLMERSGRIDAGLDCPDGVEEPLWSIVHRALASQPGQRQPHSRALADDLWGYLTEGTGPASLDEPTTEVSPSLLAMCEEG